MYVFIDEQGEQVTVRSSRTLERLLAGGRISAATRFRREDERDFVPAAEHAELIQILTQAGITLATSGPASPEPPSDAPTQPVGSDPTAMPNRDAIGSVVNVPEGHAYQPLLPAAAQLASPADVTAGGGSAARSRRSGEHPVAAAERTNCAAEPGCATACCRRHLSRRRP